MSKFQTALDHVSRVTMTMPLNDQIITLQECVDQRDKLEKALNKVCMFISNDDDCACPAEYKNCNNKCFDCIKEWSFENE